MIPLVAENLAMETTRVWLPVARMIPEDVEQELRALVAIAYGRLSELGLVILMLAHGFGEVGNEDIQHYRREHPQDIGTQLRQLVSAGWLDKDGHGRGTRYRWPRAAGRDLFDGIAADEPAGSEQTGPASEHLDGGSEQLDSAQEARLAALAAVVQGKPKVPKPLMEETILALCAEDWLSLRTLARLLSREPDSLRNHYINAMLQDGRLEARVPGKRTHPDQAYRRRG